jgi:gas vesicle protein
MENNIEERVYNKNEPLNFLIGALIGGLAGAVAMLLFAPQSGKRTRAQILNKSIQLRDRTTTGVKKAVAQVRSGTDKVKTGVRVKVGKLKQFSQDKLVEQMDHMSDALDAGKTAVKTA